MSGIAVILLISGKHVQAERESFNFHSVLSCFIPAVRIMPDRCKIRCLRLCFIPAVRIMPKEANGVRNKFGGSFGRFTPKRKK